MYNVLILSWCDLNDISLTIREHELQIIDLFIINIMTSLHLLSRIALEFNTVTQSDMDFGYSFLVLFRVIGWNIFYGTGNYWNIY